MSVTADDFEDGELAKTVGKAIANRRKRMALTQEQLSEAAGIAQASLSHIERGQVLPSLDRLAQLAALLHCRLADLLAEAGTTPGDRATRIHEKLSALAPAQQEALERLLDEAIKLVTNSRAEPRRKAR
ncbi:helix-turn-helix domain-containing protein [Burkholderia cepacia]|uniref:Helix-turn-helix domain-containing protein n=2 Tax=Burkholderia cepacia complex TaxID=87882 RepID=A0A3N8PUS7_9BURK|nr:MULTISPECIES: helix-turn-helix domain-containing protein [Burkholderia]AOJ91389.1 Cro/Cl family transcriptional regulator [Burkholderia sp. MSMB0856]RQT14840.1 helix-turn-helix domain-containing protein [Burkholderia contaminans]HDR9173022.1 helix-turn-helix domain-containing protein [Burkholderia vietnamiensis]KVH39270.1 Cro/Cl family transcriptional regulator [Burkholderia sp. MSMB0856]RQS26523.1 helix-turn-helix domain-containing protein [Burkholderia sp. Bp8995]